MSNPLAKTTQSCSLGSALKNGGPLIWLSCLIMGLGNMVCGQCIYKF